jgi:hypothetical protein
MKLTFLTLTSLLLMVPAARANESEMLATNLPATIELRDQFNEPQKLSLPLTNITLLAIADKKGSDQVSDWIGALKARYSDRIDYRGLADMTGVPPFLQSTIRKQFRKTCSHPVMMDWSGKVCAQLGYRRGVSNILVLGCDGVVLARFSGPASETNLRQAVAALDSALSIRPSIISTAKSDSDKLNAHDP